MVPARGALDRMLDVPPSIRTPLRIALSVPLGSELESQLVQSGFSIRAGVSELLGELEQGLVAVPELLLLRGTVQTAAAELLRLREVRALTRVPIICVLGDGRRDDQRACERASAFACLREPLSSQALATAIEAGLVGGAGGRASLAPAQDAGSLVREIALSVRSPNQVPAAVDQLSALCPEPARQGLGLAELIMNAIEHGNLEITGELKAELLTGDLLESEISRRLAEPRYAGREAQVRLTRYPDHVELVVEDDGPGFDWRKQLEKVIDFEAPCGRGLRLAQQLSFDSLEYLGRGNVAVARVRHEVTRRGGLSGVSDWERRSIEMQTDRFLDRLADGALFEGALKLCLELTESTRGLIGYSDKFGMVVVPACHVEPALPKGTPFSIARDSWPAAWRRTLQGGSAEVCEDGLGLELVGAPPRAEPTLSVPIVQAGRVIGIMLVAGAARGYTGLDAERLEIALGKLATVFVAQVEAALAWSARQRLEESTVTAHFEQEAAAHVMQCLRGEASTDPSVRHFSSSREIFNGDLVLSARLPDGRLRVMLADFVGHGLAAAIGGLPLSSIFHATARKQISMPEVLATMNDALRKFLPSGYFCGAVLLDLDVGRSSVQFWNGGMPPTLVWRPGRKQLSLLASNHLPLGVVNSAELGVEVGTVGVEPGDQLLIMSDGVTEFEGPSGELFGLQRLEAALRNAPERDPFDTVSDALTEFAELLSQANDDVSLIRISVAADGEARFSNAPRA